MSQSKLAAKSLREVCEERGKQGEAAYAIAAAIFDLSDSQEATAKALQRLGNGNASTDFGAIESLGMQIEKAATLISDALSSATSELANSLQPE